MVTLVLGMVVFYVILLKRNDNYWKRRGIPFIKFRLVNDIMAIVVLKRKGLVDDALEVYRKFHGEKFCGYFQFMSPVIVVRDPELIKRVLITDFVHFEDRGPPTKSKDLMALTLGSLTGNEWRYVRHKLTPTFTSGKVKMMFGDVRECSEHVLSYIESKTGCDVDAKRLIQRYLLNIAGNVGFGVKLDTFNEKDERSVEFLKACSAIFEISRSVFFKFIICSAFPKLRALLNLRLMDGKNEEFFRNLTNDLIKVRQLENEKRSDFLQLMLDLKNQEKENLNNGISGCYRTDSDEFMESEDKVLMENLQNTPVGTRDSSDLGNYLSKFS